MPNITIKAATEEAKQGIHNRAIAIIEGFRAGAHHLEHSDHSSEYKQIFLSLVLLKFLSDRFDEQRQQLIFSGLGDHVDLVELYTKDDVSYLSEETRWSTIQNPGEAKDLALRIDTALQAIKKTHPLLGEVLPKNYCCRASLDINCLSSLIANIGKVNPITNNSEPVADATAEQHLAVSVYECFLTKIQ